MCPPFCAQPEDKSAGGQGTGASASASQAHHALQGYSTAMMLAAARLAGGSAGASSSHEPYSFPDPAELQRFILDSSRRCVYFALFCLLACSLLRV